MGVDGNRQAKKITLFLFVVVILAVGAFYVTDYGDGVLTGTYASDANGQRVSLLIRQDDTFHQIRVINGVRDEFDGTWRRVGEAYVAFSGGMMALPQQRIMPKGIAYASLNKTWGIWPYISLDSITTAPIYRKRFLGFAH